MGKYIKLFETHSQYTAFTQTEDFILPNVSYCIDVDDVHYNPFVDSRLVVTYNVVDASNPTLLYAYYAEEGQEEWWVKGIDLFDKVEIDGTEVSVSDLDAASGTYQLSAGEHTVAYTLKDPTIIGGVQIDESTFKIGAAFGGCSAITNVRIPNSVTTIGEYAFGDCTGLTNVNIPDNVITIGESAFSGCSSLENITIPDNTTTIGRNAFYNCTNLTNITIGSGVTSINDEIFTNCNSLTTIVITNTSISIEGCWANNGFWVFPLDQATKNLLLSINSDIMCYYG